MYVWDYLKVRSDSEVLSKFKGEVQRFFALRSKEEDWSLISPPGYFPRDDQEQEKQKRDFATLRERIARTVPRIRQVLTRLGKSEIYVVQAPLLTGGPVIDFPLLYGILSPENVPGCALSEDNILDFLNECIGETELRVEERWRKILNPFQWVGSMLVYLWNLRIPIADLLGQVLKNIIKRG